MSNNSTQENPFVLTQGYEPNHDYAMTGYGLTIDSIYYWLFEKHLPTQEIGFEKAVGESAEDTTGTEFDEFLTNKDPKTIINYVDTSTADVRALMVFSYDPQVTTQVVPNMKTVNEKLVNAINTLYLVPDKYQTALKQFVDDYAGYINICDFS